MRGQVSQHHAGFVPEKGRLRRNIRRPFRLEASRYPMAYNYSCTTKKCSKKLVLRCRQIPAGYSFDEKNVALN